MMSRFLGAIIIVALLMGSLPQIAFAAPTPAVTVTCARYHNVVSGDTLSAISVTYDISITELAAANNLQQPYTLIIDQRLCIPGSATSSSGTSSSTSTSTDKPVIAVDRDGKFLVITVANFPQKNSYYVKIKKGHLSSDRPWVKIGIFRTKKNNNVQRVFRLPSNFYDPSLIYVCLKNGKTDAVSCAPHWE